MFNPRAFYNSGPEGFGVLEVAASPDAPLAYHEFVPLRRTALTGEIAGALGALTLTQTFGFTHEQRDAVVEALYRFPLPGDAAVTGVRVRFGDVEIRAELKERAAAEKEYDAALAAGRQAALATRETPDVFTLRVAGIQPDEDVVVETAFVVLCKPEAAGWSLRVPLTTSPRFVREDERGSRHAQGQPLALARDPGHRFALDLMLRETAAADSPTHALEAVGTPGGVRVRLREGEVVPDRDFVLRWQPAQDENRPALSAIVHRDSQADRVYFEALLAPPGRGSAARPAPREVILLVDHSGSMEGAKWNAADWAVKRFLSDLTEQDTFALGLFHNSTRWFAEKPRPADAETVAEAVRFLEEHRDSGGTELGVALEQALRLPQTGGERSRHVLLVTDAEVSDQGRILRLADEEARQPKHPTRGARRRISVICIDAAPNAYLATELAERGGGVCRFLTSSPDEEDIATALDDVLADWAAPVLTGLRLEVDRPGMEAAGRLAADASEKGWSAIDMGDLPTGRALWVCGRAPAGGESLRLRVVNAQGREAASCAVDLRSAPAFPALKALFGARRVAAIEHLMGAGYRGDEAADALRRIGYDPAAVGAGSAPPSVYAENARDEMSKALKAMLVREALDYGLASSETAFVAQRWEAGKPVEEAVVVANALPTGWSGAFASVGAPGAVMRAVMPSQGMRNAMPATPPVGFAAMDALDVPPFLRHAQPAAPRSRSLFRAARTAPPAAAAAGGNRLAEPKPASGHVVFGGTPAFTGREAVLLDSDGGALVPPSVTLTGLSLSFPDGAPPAGALNADLRLLVYVGDMAVPRARVRLVDLARQHGVRPMNVRRNGVARVRILLEDPSGRWASGAPRLDLALSW